MSRTGAPTTLQTLNKILYIYCSLITSSPVGLRRIVTSVSVCLSVYPPGYLKKPLVQTSQFFVRVTCGIGDANRECALSDSPGAAPGAKSDVYDCLVD